MEDLSLHILDIVENSTAAGATFIEIKIINDTVENILKIIIRDNGAGMDNDMVQKVKDPFTTTRSTRRVGLGLSLLDQAATEADGGLAITSEKGKGTELTATFRSDHIDRKPVGDMAQTLVTLISGNPDIDFHYYQADDGVIRELDTREIRRELDGVSLNHPEVLKLIRGLFQ